MKIKIIDLLVRIANCEEVPCKIKYLNNLWIYDKNEGDYRSDKKGACLFKWFFINGSTIFLNDEIEIIEEDKKIEELDVQYYDDERYTPETRLNICMNYINKLIAEVNKLKGEK